MNFDIKDVKSWSTRNEVELGKIGFFADSIEQLYKEECVISKLSLITKKMLLALVMKIIIVTHFSYH